MKKTLDPPGAASFYIKDQHMIFTNAGIRTNLTLDADIENVLGPAHHGQGLLPPLLYHRPHGLTEFGLFVQNPGKI